MKLNKRIKVNYLARVEGEGGLSVKLKDGRVIDTKLNIFEPPRFFEGFLRGRDFAEAPDITARICGICPVAYQMSSCHAMENALGINVDEQLRSLRRLLYCGEWIESHALHVYMLHAPDFLGYEDSIRMAKDHPDIVKRGLQLKKLGNEIVTCLGGREIHPINVRVGGFYKLPEKKDLLTIGEKLKQAVDDACQTVKWVSTFSFPDYTCDYEFVSLRHPDEYPFNEGRIVSNKSLDISINEYEQNFVESHVKHSSALQSTRKNSGLYLAGPLARYNLNFDRLTPLARESAIAAGLSATCLNPFQSIIVRSVEILYACQEALRITESYEEPEHVAVEIQPTHSTGYGCTEAPRGMLYHRYSIDGDGKILMAKIVPPTSQNQKSIERDLGNVVEKYITLDEYELTLKCEQTVRNYDPCISCSVH